MLKIKNRVDQDQAMTQTNEPSIKITLSLDMAIYKIKSEINPIDVQQIILKMSHLTAIHLRL